MNASVRPAQPSDYGRVIGRVNVWWGGRDMAPMLPKLFFVHFEGTSFVAEDEEGNLAAFLIGFLSQTDARRRTSTSSASTPSGVARGSDATSTSASSRRRASTAGSACAVSPHR